MRPPAKRGRRRPPNRREKKSSNAAPPDNEYKVGPGRPPREFWFKPGQSGNPKGASRKRSSIAPDLKVLLERALNKGVKLRRGEREKIFSKAAVGIDALVNQFAKGDHRARRDLIVLAEKLGVDLTAGRTEMIENALSEALSAEDEALLADYVRRHGGGHARRGDSNVVRFPKSKRSRKAGPINEEKTS